MTVKVAPEFWVNQGPATDVEANKLHTTAAAFRRMLDSMLQGRPGVVYTRGTCQDLKVNASAVPDVNITIKAGACYVRGTQATDQGMYHIYNDADLVIPMLTNNPANATNPRIDLVIARMQDQQYSGATDLPTIEVWAGVPAASPAVPAPPANSIILAQILVPAASTTVTQANITDRRPSAGAGPVLLDEILVGTDARYPAATALLTFLNTTGGVANLLPPGFRHLLIEWYSRGDTAAISTALSARLNNVGTYDQQVGTFRAAAALAGESLGLTSGQIGTMPANTATANYFGTGRAEVRMYAASLGSKPISGQDAYATADTTGTQNADAYLAKWRTPNVPVTRLDLLPGAGNIVVGSHFALWGLVPFAP